MSAAQVNVLWLMAMIVLMSVTSFCSGWLWAYSRGKRDGRMEVLDTMTRIMADQGEEPEKQ